MWRDSPDLEIYDPGITTLTCLCRISGLSQKVRVVGVLVLKPQTIILKEDLDVTLARITGTFRKFMPCVTGFYVTFDRRTLEEL